jgi:hypothetical protein
MEYRLYFYGTENTIGAVQELTAADDTEAAETGSVLFNAVKDVFWKHEIWCGARQIISLEPGSDLTLAALSEARQQRAVEMELIMAASFARVRHSQRLLAETEHLLQDRPVQIIHELAANEV